MQIRSNTTGMLAGLSAATDKEGRDHCVAVVKGTFEITPSSAPRLADEQAPLVYADVHHGDPGATSIRYECDFAPSKRRTDVLFNASAHAPGGRPIEKLLVEMAVGMSRKTLLVTGDREWGGLLGGLRPSSPAPFVTMPIVYERAFGGIDQSHADQRRHGAELRNPVGVGFRKNTDASAARGTPLPNVEDPRAPMQSWNDTPVPQGFAGIGRGWQPRLAHAGTYDQAWLDQRYPFLPADFDDRYFLCAPTDQQFPFLQGGEQIRCKNLTAQGDWGFEVPKTAVPLLFRFSDRDVRAAPRIDTLIVEPGQNRFIVVWRASVPIGRKMNLLREVVVGKPGRQMPLRWRAGKPHFASLAELDGWRGSPLPDTSQAD